MPSTLFAGGSVAALCEALANFTNCQLTSLDHNPNYKVFGALGIAALPLPLVQNQSCGAQRTASRLTAIRRSPSELDARVMRHTCWIDADNLVLVVTQASKSIVPFSRSSLPLDSRCSVSARVMNQLVAAPLTTS
jgi:hypothetical protein